MLSGKSLCLFFSTMSRILCTFLPYADNPGNKRSATLKPTLVSVSLSRRSCYLLHSFSLSFNPFVADLRKRTTKPNIEAYSALRRVGRRFDVGSGPPNLHMTPGQVRRLSNDNNNGHRRAKKKKI